ncbi:MAG: hypothetical protein II067_09930 [Agathobacter sp.]|uniref:hypothetical protein n=1 Tax=Agathobacter sp. TaxID=2021311 RepID=UPI00257966F2|nr:hypothetical protein [Agathobacter sp.]MBQ1682512.1 hypothetical protein [Agathobacter sp.]
MLKITSSPELYTHFETFLFDLPWLFYAGVEVLIGILLLIGSRENILYSNSSPTSETIRQAVDLLPEGIVISSRDGTVRLCNLKMNDLSKALTGDLLSDAGRLWSVVVETGKEQGGKYLVRLPSKEVWLFEKGSFTAGEQTYTQITSVDVTERYRIIDELEEKNDHLLDIRRRMKAVSDLSGDMFVAQEEADARAALHNQLGQVLLMGRHYILHPDVTDPDVVYAATKQMNQFLLGESEEPYQGEEDAVTSAIAMANSIGVRVEIKDTEHPDSGYSKGTVASLEERIKVILAQAITECAANTVKHAEGDTVTVTIDQEKTIRITNNGKPPKGEIVVSGGLLSLRRRIQEEDGTMELESAPSFLLIMHF